MTERVAHIDIAKGISIVLVALFHSRLKQYIPDAVDAMSLFRMPLFFFLSGVFFSASMQPGAFLQKKSDALLKPYFATLLVILVVAALSLHAQPPWLSLRILYGNEHGVDWVALWFLPHLFLVNCLVYVLFRYGRFEKAAAPLRYGVAAAMLVVGAGWIDAFWPVQAGVPGQDVQLRGLPMGLDIVLVSTAFFVMGSLARDGVIRFRPTPLLLSITVLCFFLVVLLTAAHVDLNKRIYDSPLLATVGAACGIYFVLALSWYFVKLPGVRGVLSFLGRSSLFVLIFHGFVGAKVFQMLRAAGLEPRVVAAAVAFLASVSVPLLIRAVVMRSDVLSLFYLPLRSNRLLQRERVRG